MAKRQKVEESSCWSQPTTQKTKTRECTFSDPELRFCDDCSGCSLVGRTRYVNWCRHWWQNQVQARYEQFRKRVPPYNKPTRGKCRWCGTEDSQLLKANGDCKICFTAADKLKQSHGVSIFQSKRNNIKPKKEEEQMVAATHQCKRCPDAVSPGTLLCRKCNAEQMKRYKLIALKREEQELTERTPTESSLSTVSC
eukprot:TRINITY_DN46960_c0_g1_i1.p1 TRINITY_DN46960_c0_g1~~TRINITY_DN46960_c0_g1_i1.p1  ORF type:complete len:223 (+),score=21.45 TRINITY_DN46960_c0_g1_i1:82-669(+)